MAEKKQLSVAIPTALHDRLTKAADDRVVGVSLLVTRALEDLLDRLPPMSVVLTAEEGEDDEAE